ncbi:DUF5133 domain-containing protein [Streptomyces anulatus]|uniref:DUF5133 domain-containing protein n=1 Tax=Streptomyces anulatus TaxID=1892 RepID=UPI0033E07B36
MLMANPAVLERLIEEYESLQILGAGHGSPQARQRMDDVMYTLCVSTGTRDIDDALRAARHLLLTTPEGQSGGRP